MRWRSSGQQASTLQQKIHLITDPLTTRQKAMNKGFILEDEKLREIRARTWVKTTEVFTVNGVTATNTPKRQPCRMWRLERLRWPLQAEATQDSFGERKLNLKDSPGACQWYPCLAQVRCQAERWNSPLNHSKVSHRWALKGNCPWAPNKHMWWAWSGTWGLTDTCWALRKPLATVCIGFQLSVRRDSRTLW